MNEYTMIGQNNTARERLNNIKDFSEFSPNYKLLSDDDFRFLLHHARIAIEAAAAPDEITAATEVFFSSRIDSGFARSQFEKALTAAAVWRKAHEPRPVLSNVISNGIVADLYRGDHAADQPKPAEPCFQTRVQVWMDACFGPVISADKIERNHRFLEEAIELVQACGCTQSEAHQLVEYVYSRPAGVIDQEIGGVMVTLAALCLANGADMRGAGETELARVWTKVEQIRAKQAAKPRHSPLPETVESKPVEGERDEWEEANHTLAAALQETKAQRDALRAQVETLREALTPFAAAYDSGRYTDRDDISDTKAAEQIRFGDLRRARAALAATEETRDDK